MTGRANSQWIGRVKAMLLAGYGVEDIALLLGCEVEAVRQEVQILRQMGVLKDMFGGA